jgi:uncharacterized membrane protein
MGAIIRTDGVTPRWRRIVLPASLGLNLFLLALVGGFVWHQHSIQGRPLIRALARVEASLQTKDAAAFDAAFKRDVPGFAPAAHQLAQARQQLQHQIAAKDFDQAAVREAFKNWGLAWDHFLGEFSNTLVDALAHVSPEGRQKLVAEWRAAQGLSPNE